MSNGTMSTPKTTKTGTTICGAIFKDGVVVGADTRSTGGDIVADKNCMKIHPLAPNMVIELMIKIKGILEHVKRARNLLDLLGKCTEH